MVKKIQKQKAKVKVKKTKTKKTVKKTSKKVVKKIVKNNKDVKRKSLMGSDCYYCSLAEGVYCMMYFCKLKSKKGSREICEDGFTGVCPDYKKKK